MSQISLSNTFPLTLNSLEKIITEQWFAFIEKDKDLYSVEIKPDLNQKDYGHLTIKYKGKKLSTIHIFKKVTHKSSGQCHISGVFYLYGYNDADAIIEPDYDKVELTVDEYGNALYLKDGKALNLAQGLMKILPIREDDKVKAIKDEFNIDDKDIVFDSYNSQYIIKAKLPDFIQRQEEKPTTFYKYTSLDVFVAMLTYKSFRMNSITSQSDRTESLFLGDLLCDEYKDTNFRAKEFYNEKNYLISSFTTLYDDKDMWEKYGDNGQGVMLEFEFIDNNNNTLTPIQYVDPKDSQILKYREKTEKLKNKDIHIHFSDIDEHRRFVKNNIYEHEKEWRFIFETKDELSFTVYKENEKKRFAIYKDFAFNKNEIPELGLRISAIITGPEISYETNDFTSIAEYTKKLLHISIINRNSK